MSVARASGTDLASSLKRNTFWTLGVRPGRGAARGPGTGGRAGPRDVGPRGAPGRGAVRGPGTEDVVT